MSNNECHGSRGRREFVAGLVGAGVWVACTDPVEALQRAPGSAPGSWNAFVDWKVGVPEAHLDLVLPSTVFSSLKDVVGYSFILCGHELFKCTSANDASGDHKLPRSFILEPSSDHQFRIFAQTKSGVVMRQYQDLTLKINKRQYFVASLSCTVSPSTERVTGDLKELAAPLKTELGRAEQSNCCCSTKG